ncbi:DUF523 domain-containing protein [Paludibacterium paludis]|uniref:DUF523 domain-containing protein n=1 Tax=Paludibacterium paludis TaxID=1225769 RepID=A0A918NZH9_9NEIS|nr:DUF523 domain-containing protein [Paludibacterium paludis]GGY08709.1 hypothetical protein GCM10011289_09370 [Paludibacterium paludis]
MKNKLLISACLLGHPVRYDGGAKGLPDETLRDLRQRFGLIPVCPECAGGLPTPRAPAEIEPGRSASDVLRGQGSVITATGDDVTAEFLSGADKVLGIAQETGAGCALLKANSPSCGKLAVYDGHFAGKLVPGEGITAHRLRQAGIPVFSETELNLLP